MKSQNRLCIYSVWLALILLGGCASAPSGRLFVVPVKPSPTNHYLFYLHEGDLEDVGPDDKQVQNYEKMIKLWTEQGFLVFSEHRDIVEVASYARKISDQVNLLIQRGVPARNISVVGYSKGSLIAQSVAERIENPAVNFVLLAGCADSLPLGKNGFQGRVLSIIDSGDNVFQSCNKKLGKKRDGLDFKEISLNSGLGHNLFRVPREKYTKLWQSPLREWLAVASPDK